MQSPAGLSASRALDPGEFDALRESVATTLAKECNSLAVHAFIDGCSDLDATLWRQAADLGWLAIALAEERGGLGLGAGGIRLLCRELGACAAPGAFIPTLCGMAWLVQVGGESAVPLIDRLLAGAISLALPARADATALRRAGGGVTGTVELLAGGPGPVAIVSVAEGWALADLAGVQTERLETWDRTRVVVRATFSGAAGQLLHSLLAIALAADSIGAADAIVRKTIAYLKDRVQFERPIASFQAIKHRVADLVIAIASQDALLDQAVENVDLGSQDANLWARLAKAGASDAAASITGECITLHGGVGHTWEYDPHIYAKRARLNQFLLGDNGELRRTAVAALALAVAAGRAVTEIAA